MYLPSSQPSLAKDLKFYYKKCPDEILRPVIPVEIIYNSRRVIYEVLIDSGADKCIVDARVGKFLGIQIEEGKEEKVSGITGVEETYFTHSVFLKVGDVEYETTVGFLQGIAEMGYGVVGQIGFFDKFKVSFNYRNKSIFLKKF